MGGLAATTRHAVDALIGSAADADTVQQLFRESSRRLRRLVQYDAAAWMAADPATGLPTSPTRIENIDLGPDGCTRIWELEYLAEDVLRFRDLARAELPAGGLRAATGDDPARSARYRALLRPNGFHDELRAVLRVDGTAWGLVSLFRAEGRPPFDEADGELVAGVSAPLATAVRDHARRRDRARASTADHGPGLMLFGPDGSLVSINDDALAWLDELDDRSADTAEFGLRLPMVVLSAAIRARAIAERRDPGIARARIRCAATGRWLICHASTLRDPDGGMGTTALVIEPAQASEIAPIITEAYELTQREQQITELIAQGYGTAEIANRLFLSPHTVRDHVKAIFDKVSVSSRGELVAKLFAEHYAPIHNDPRGIELVMGAPTGAA